MSVGIPQAAAAARSWSNQKGAQKNSDEDESEEDDDYEPDDGVQDDALDNGDEEGNSESEEEEDDDEEDGEGDESESGEDSEEEKVLDEDTGVFSNTFVAGFTMFPVLLPRSRKSIPLNHYLYGMVSDSFMPF